MTSPTARWIAWAVFGFAALCLGFNLVAAALNTSGPDPVAPGAALAACAFYVAMLAFAVAGLLIALRQPRNPIGWILLAIGVVWELPSEELVRYGMITAPGSVARPDLIAVLTASLWVPGVGLMGTFLLLLFPDGRLPSSRWRPMAWVSALSLVLVTLIIPLTPASLREVAAYTFLPRTPNPLGVAALAPVVDLLAALVMLVPLCIVGCALSLVGRFRRADGRQRQQMKWLAVGGVVAAAVYLVMMLLSAVYGGTAWADENTPAWLVTLQNMTIFVFVLLPIAVGIAILRHRLYDIDVIINRALVYGGLTAALAVVYIGGVFGVGAVVRALSGQERSSLAVAVSTLAVAGLFAPLRRRMQALIDRRFYRRKYDAQQAVTDFAVSLRRQVDLVPLRNDLVETVAATIQPVTVSLWLKPPDAATAGPDRPARPLAG